MLSPEDIERARRTSPEAFLKARFRDVSVNRGRTALSVDKVLRADRKSNGSWVACDWYGSGIGDTIAVVQYVDRCRFVDAVELLVGSTSPIPRLPEPAPQQDKPTRPRLPMRNEAELGRRYLMDRGISADTLKEAERQGCLTYIRNAVVFIGRDAAREVRFAALRYLTPVSLPPREGHPEDAHRGPLSKRDLRGSDKAYPFILQGSPDILIAVEGGTNALAARDLWLRQHGVAPTVLATGGVGVRLWLKQDGPALQTLRKARTVLLLGENERSDNAPDPFKQQRTDEIRAAVLAEMNDARAGLAHVQMVYPPREAKDAADWNKDFPSLQGWEVVVQESPLPVQPAGRIG